MWYRTAYHILPEPGACLYINCYKKAQILKQKIDEWSEMNFVPPHDKYIALYGADMQQSMHSETLMYNSQIKVRRTR
jgi:hypothetical protein